MTKDQGLVLFICDYCRLILIGGARSHEIEALMEEEIGTHKKYALKPYAAINTVGRRCRRSASSRRCSAS